MPSSINSNVVDGNGDGGNLNINTQNLVLSNQGFISTANAGSGNSGDIKIDVNSLAITERGRIDGGVRGTGNGSNITINAEDSVSVIGNSEFSSFIAVNIESTGTGQAGNIEINTPELAVRDGFISADVFGNGEGGTIDISISELIVQDGSFISADVFGNGNGGTINISASDSIELFNTALIQAVVFEDSTGNAG
ncbi:MAG: hypothetical protein AAFQ14_12220, partial [Cyanobacteria bacterium J06621_12]